MYNRERRLRYSHFLTRHCPCNLLPEPTSHKHEYRGQIWGHPVMLSMTSSPWKYFFGMIWDGLFISEVKLKLWLIFKNCQNGRHFEVATNVFAGYNIGRSIYQKDSHEYFRYFELLIDALAEILMGMNQFLKNDLLCDLVTSSMTSRIRIYVNLIIISWCLCTGSLMMTSSFVFSYHEKCCYFIYKGIYKADFEATLWRHRWRHHHEKNFFIIICDIFLPQVKLKLCLIFHNFQNGRHFELATNFFTWSDTGSWIY